MIINTTPCRLLLLGVVFLLSVNAVYPRPRKRSGLHKKASSVKPALPPAEEAEPAQTSQESPPVRLKLADGTLIRVDEAWDSPQGIWYKQGGVSYLVPRERVKAIEHSSKARPKPALELAKVAGAGAKQTKAATRPVWIYLAGGARLEADTADESSAGVWFRRGSLSLFIERSRIDHLEREELESLAESESSAKERGWSTGSAKIDSLIRQNGLKYGVDPYLIFCVMEQESHFSARSVSPKGARGLMQLMPSTSARFGVRHPFNPAESISAGTRYLRQLIEQFHGRIDLVLAGYNAGEGTVIRYGSKVPPYKETRDYVKRIGYRYRRTKAPVVRAADSQATAGEM